MKKLLEIFSALSITASASAAVLACGTDKEEDFNEDTQLTEEEKAKLRNQLIAEATRLSENHIQGNQDSLYTSTTTTNNFKFLNYENLLSKASLKDGTDESIEFSGTEQSNFKNDIDDILNISGELRANIQSVLSENSQYAFLLVNIDNILADFSFEDAITVSATKTSKSDNAEYVLTVKFNIYFSFNYLWANEKETFHTSGIDLNFLIMPESFINAGVSDIVTKLASNLFTNDTDDFFKLTEEKFGISSNVFASQASNVYSYFTKYANAESLKNKVSSAISTILSEQSQSAVEFNYQDIQVASIKRLYTGAINHTIVTDGYLDKALFNKDSEVNSKQLDSTFESDFATSYSKSGFVSRESTTIANTFGIKTSSISNTEFTEYGELKLENLTLTILGIKVNLNPISLLYVYNPITSFARRAANVFTNWRGNWGVTTSNDRFALFKLSESTLAGKAFFAGNPYYPFSFVTNSNASVYFPSNLYNNTGLNAFSISHSNSSRNPYSSFDAKGFAVNFSGYSNTNWSASNLNYARSWLMVVTIGEIKITINFAYNQDYWTNVWMGKGSKNSTIKYIIEKGA